MKVSELLGEKMHNIISAYVKDNEKFTLWQDGHYYYSLAKSVQDKSGKFQTIKTFNDKSLDEVENWLNGAGYKKQELKEETVSEGPVHFDMFAKRKAAENKERLAKQREQQRKEKAKTVEKAKVDDKEARYEKGKLTDAELDKVWMMINDAIGQTFPDSDPMDVLYPKLKKQFGEFNVTKVLDVTAKKRFKSKDFYDFLADNWDENMEAFADMHPEYKNMKNPWR